MTTWFRSPGMRRIAGVLLAALLGVCAVGVPPVRAQTPPVVLPVSWIVSGETGLLFVTVKPTHSAQFEAGIGALREVLVASPDPVRQQQRAGWRVYKQVEPWMGGGIVYLFLIHPVVPGVDYSVASILAEGRPDNRAAEVDYVSAMFGQQTLLDCSLVVDLATAAPAVEMSPDDIPLPATPVGGFQAPLFTPAAAAPASASTLPTVPDAIAAAAPPTLPPADPLAAQTAAAPSATSVAGSEPRVFSGDLGLLLMQVKQTRLADFEGSMARLKEALASSPDPGRRAQGTGWRVVRAKPPELPATAAKPVKREKAKDKDDDDDDDGETVTMAFVVDPPVPTADYTVSRILSDAYPAESSTLFKSYRRVFVGGMTLLNFTLVSDLRY
jgi:hypothetical protein